MGTTTKLTGVLALLTLWLPWLALAQAPQPTEKCDDEQASCRETCSLEFGTTYATRGRLSACLTSCDSRRKTCVIMVVDEQRRKAEHPEASKPHSSDSASDDGPVVTPRTKDDATDASTDADNTSPPPASKPRHKK